MRKALSLIVLAAALPVSATAQEWDFELAPYLWAAGIDGELAVGQQSGDFSVGFDDIVNVLDGAIILRFEGRRGNHAFFGDIVSMNLDPDTGQDGIGGTIDADIEALIVETGYSYYLTEDFAVDIGLTYWDFETLLTRQGTPVALRTSDWADVLVGGRYVAELNGKWESVTRLNLSTGGSEFVLGFDQSFKREFSNGDHLLLGFRVLNTEYDNVGPFGAGIGIDATFAGMTIGYVFD